MGKLIRILVSGLFIAMSVSSRAAEVDVPNTFEAGEPASADQVNANFDALQNAVNDHAARLNRLDPVVEPAPLAFELNGNPDLMPLQGAAGGGRKRTSGGLLQPRPLVVHGLPGGLSELIRMLDEGRRFNGRVLRLADDSATAQIALNNTLVRSVGVPAVGPHATEPFRVSVTFNATAGEADLGPFEPEQVVAPATGEVFVPGLELALPGEGVTVSPVAIDAARVWRNDGGRLQADNIVLRVPSADAGPLLDAFTGGLRLSNPAVRYLGTDGAVALEVTADLGQIVAAAPDFTVGEATTIIELELETSTSSTVRVSAP